LLSGEAQWERINVEREIWKQGENPINAVIQQRSKAMSLAVVRRTFQENHLCVLDKLQSLSDEDLHRPYNYYQPKTIREQPIILWIQGNTYEHYAAHQP
jgi:hypothetical protein